MQSDLIEFQRFHHGSRGDKNVLLGSDPSRLCLMKVFFDSDTAENLLTDFVATWSLDKSQRIKNRISRE